MFTMIHLSITDGQTCRPGDDVRTGNSATGRFPPTLVSAANSHILGNEVTETNSNGHLLIMYSKYVPPKLT